MTRVESLSISPEWEEKIGKKVDELKKDRMLSEFLCAAVEREMEKEEKEELIALTATFYCGNCAGKLKQGENSDNCSNCKSLKIQSQKLEEERQARVEMLRMQEALKEQRQKVATRLQSIIDKGEDNKTREEAKRFILRINAKIIEPDNEQVISFLNTKEGSNPVEAEVLPELYSTHQGEDPLKLSGEEQNE